MQSQTSEEIARYLRTGEYDDSYSAWLAPGYLQRAKLAHEALRQALVEEVRRRSTRAAERTDLVGLNLVAFTRERVAPMVRGLFPRAEQEVVLDLLGRSVVFLTPSNIDAVLTRTSWHGTAWALANLYLASVGAEPLSGEASKIVGLSEDTTCYVSAEYFRSAGRFEDFIVHEAAHLLHNCKRRTIGLRETRRREWLVELEFSKRETFAYTCEAYGVLDRSRRPAERGRLLLELEAEPPPAADRVDAGEYRSILREAVAARNGWRVILERCSPPRPARRPHHVMA
jgi:hypothetical protein